MRPLLMVLACAACSNSGDALVVVTVSSPGKSLSDVAKLHARGTAAGRPKDFDVSFSTGATFAIPPERTFGVQIPEGLTGTFSLELDAVDGAGAILSSGSNFTTTSPGQRANLALMLGVDISPDMAAGDGMVDGSPGDAAGDGAFGDGCVPLTCVQANYGCGTLSTCGMDVDCGPCLLASLHPAVANDGDILTLEGSFNPNVVVVFSGGVSANPTLLGPNRATVAVPAGVSTGPVGLSLGGGATLLRQQFRRAGFALGLHYFRQSWEQAETARPVTTTLTQRSLSGVAQVGFNVEIFGGEDNSGPSPTPVPTMESTGLNFDGTAGSFSTDGNKSLVTPRSGFGTYANSNSVYVVGGYDATHTALASVERAQIHGDGSGVDTFTATATPLVQARWLPASAVIGKYLYVFGGGGGVFNPGPGVQILKSIERAPISNIDGSLGAFEAVTTQMSTGRAGAVALVLRDQVYLIGGLDPNGSFLSSIETAAINGDGTLGTFATAVPALKVDRALPGIVELGGQVYAIGGASSTSMPNGGSPINTVESAPIGPNGKLGLFTNTDITTVRGRTGQPLLVGNYLTYFQSAGGGSGTNTMERAPILRGGTVGAFADSGRSLVPARTQMATTIVGADVYLFGGVFQAGITADIVHARVDQDGNLSAFTGMIGGNAIPSLKTARAGAAVAVFDRDIWVCGGLAPGDNALDNCEGFHAGPDGMLNPFTIDATMASMGTKRVDFHMVVFDNTLFAVGGDGGGWATISSIGLDAAHHPTGSWFGAPSIGLFQIKASGRMGVQVGQHEYVIGGDDSNAGVEIADYASNSIGTFATAAITALPVRFDGVIVPLGSSLLLAGGGVPFNRMDMGSPAAIGDVDRAPMIVVDGNPTIDTFTDINRRLVHARRGHVGIAVGNTVTLIGGADSSGPMGSIEQAPIQ
jgi:hypothetical protein